MKKNIGNWDLPCPKCGSLDKTGSLLGSIHGHGYLDGGGSFSCYSHTCGECETYFKKTYTYKNGEVKVTYYAEEKQGKK